MGLFFSARWVPMYQELLERGGCGAGEFLIGQVLALFYLSGRHHVTSYSLQLFSSRQLLCLTMSTQKRNWTSGKTIIWYCYSNASYMLMLTAKVINLWKKFSQIDCIERSCSCCCSEPHCGVFLFFSLHFYSCSWFIDIIQLKERSQYILFDFLSFLFL